MRSDQSVDVVSSCWRLLEHYDISRLYRHLSWSSRIALWPEFRCCHLAWYASARLSGLISRSQRLLRVQLWLVWTSPRPAPRLFRTCADLPVRHVSDEDMRLLLAFGSDHRAMLHQSSTPCANGREFRRKFRPPSRHPPCSLGSRSGREQVKL